jgi:hypothetical protein
VNRFCVWRARSDAELKKYISQLNILARLRDLARLTIQTVSKMPITFDIENDALVVVLTKIVCMYLFVIALIPIRLINNKVVFKNIEP